MLSLLMCLLSLTMFVYVGVICGLYDVCVTIVCALDTVVVVVVVAVVDVAVVAVAVSLGCDDVDTMIVACGVGGCCDG